MILKMFTIYDQKARAYLPLFFLPMAAQAQRTFADTVNSSDHQFGKHPEDYTLIEIGEFDDSSAAINPHPVPETIGTGIQFLQTRSGYEELKNDNSHALSNEPSIQSSSERGNST